jgi:hypothetical protein
VKHGGGSVTVWAAVSWFGILLVPIITLHGRITTREYVGSLGNQVHPIIQMFFFFQTTMQFCKKTLPHPHSWNCSVMVWRTRRWTSTSSLASIITRFEHYWTTLVSFGDYSEEQIPTSNISKATWRCSSRRMVLSRVWVTYRRDLHWMIGIIAYYTFTQLGTTDNTALSLFYTLSSSPLSTH